MRDSVRDAFHTGVPFDPQAEPRPITRQDRQYGESPFDRVFVARDREEFKYTRQYVLRSSDLEQHDRFLSDHYMIKVSVKDYVDDADPR